MSKYDRAFDRHILGSNICLSADKYSEISLEISEENSIKIEDLQ
jgi:hypothetical protein